MVTIAEIPISPDPQRMTLTLGDTTYRITFLYREADEGGWVMDIADDQDTPLACGIPLVTGQNLLVQLRYLGIGGAVTGGIAVASDGNDNVPTFDGLGSASRLYWITDP